MLDPGDDRKTFEMSGTTHKDTASYFKALGSYYKVFTVLNTKHRTFITNTQCLF